MVRSRAAAGSTIKYTTTSCDERPNAISPLRRLLKMNHHTSWRTTGMMLLMLFGVIALFTYHISGYASTTRTTKSMVLTHGGSTTGNPCLDYPMTHSGVPTFKRRTELGFILEREKMRYGAELGVQRGLFSFKTLKNWPSCQQYLLVDIWAPQENYKDPANVDQETQNQFYEETLNNTRTWKEKVRVCRNYTTICVKNIPDGSLDYIYVDARHDFKGVYDDLRDWWPKLRPGGIMAGHDYITQDDGPEQHGQDYTVNYDGTIDETRTVVKGAVDKFSNEVCRQLTVSYREGGWNTWAMRK